MSVSLAMLLQTTPDPSLTAQRLVDQVRTDWPDLDADRFEPGEPQEAEDDPFTMKYGNTLIMFVPVATPIPYDVAELAEYSRLWPDAQPAPVDYGAHTVVSVVTPEEDRDQIANAVLLSQLIASAVTLGPTVRAVYWGAANHLILPDIFVRLAQATLPDPMILAWVAINVGARPDGVMTGHTRGMDMLGLRDIEIPETADSPQDVFGRLAGISEYLVENGMVIGDGDTIGTTAEEKITVTYTESEFGDGREVLRLGPPPSGSSR